LIDNKLIEKNLFAFYFSFNPKKEQSELTLGFYDKNRFTGSLSWHKVTSANFFVLELQDVRLGNKSLGLCDDKKCSITPDTGTTDVTFPRWAIDQLADDPHFSKGYSCLNSKDLPALVFVLSNGKEYTLPPKHWIDREDQVCSSKIDPLTISDYGNKNMFIIGSTFMQLYYTVFDRD
jgi:cathepsin D